MSFAPSRRLLTWFSCLSFAVFLSASASAQVTGSLAGTVRDSSGAVVPGATVTVKGPALQRESVAATTTGEGTYLIQLVPPGVYEVSVALSGFNTQTRRNIEVAINQQTALDFAMPVAGVAESVVVAAGSPLVEVSRSDVQSTVQQRTIDALPLNGRNFTDL